MLPIITPSDRRHVHPETLTIQDSGRFRNLIGMARWNEMWGAMRRNHGRRWEGKLGKIGNPTEPQTLCINNVYVTHIASGPVHLKTGLAV